MSANHRHEEAYVRMFLILPRPPIPVLFFSAYDPGVNGPDVLDLGKHLLKDFFGILYLFGLRMHNYPGRE
jgi:hypothetical protein